MTQRNGDIFQKNFRVFDIFYSQKPSRKLWGLQADYLDDFVKLARRQQKASSI